MAVTNFDEYRDVFVVADTIDDVVHPVTYELIGQARSFKLCYWVRMFKPKQRNS